MTEKQEMILDAARELFANDGFEATSTSKVAKKAGVSEGLIFRHYANKEGLLKAILEEGEARARILFSDIILETQPVKVITKYLQLPEMLENDKHEQEFWKLQFKIKWETENYGEHKLEPLQMALSNAFSKLGYKDAEQEALNLIITMDGLATRFFLQKGFDIKPSIEFLFKRYNL